MKKYSFGLSFAGLAAVLLVMAPNLLYLFLSPPNDLLAANDAAFWLWNALENLGRFLLITSLLIIRPAPSKNTENRYLKTAALLCLLLYYILWSAYFSGAVNSWIFIGLAVFPTAFFILTAVRTHNYIALYPAALFAIMHISITASIFLL